VGVLLFPDQTSPTAYHLIGLRPFQLQDRLVLTGYGFQRIYKKMNDANQNIMHFTKYIDLTDN
jgi:hypothetical protein